MNFMHVGYTAPIVPWIVVMTNVVVEVFSIWLGINSSRISSFNFFFMYHLEDQGVEEVYIEIMKDNSRTT